MIFIEILRILEWIFSFENSRSLVNLGHKSLFGWSWVRAKRIYFEPTVKAELQRRQLKLIILKMPIYSNHLMTCVWSWSNQYSKGWHCAQRLRIYMIFEPPPTTTVKDCAKLYLCGKIRNTLQIPDKNYYKLYYKKTRYHGCSLYYGIADTLCGPQLPNMMIVTVLLSLQRIPWFL